MAMFSTFHLLRMSWQILRISLLGPLSMCAFRRAEPPAEKSLACSCVDPFPFDAFPHAVNFGAPKSVGCVYRHNAHAHDLAEVNMASMDEELFLLILRCGQRSRMRLTLLAHKSRQHRYWVHNILRKRKQFGCSSTRLIRSSFCLLVSFTHAILPFQDIFRVLHVIQDARGIPGESHPWHRSVGAIPSFGAPVPAHMEMHFFRRAFQHAETRTWKAGLSHLGDSNTHIPDAVLSSPQNCLWWSLVVSK